MKYLLMALLATAAVALAACVNTDKKSPATGAQTADPQTTLKAFHWLLRDAVDAQGKPLVDFAVEQERPLQLDFDAGRLGISGACNRIGGSYRLAGNDLRVGQLVSTQMACADNWLMTREQGVGRFFSVPVSYQLNRTEPPSLVLTNDHGERLTFAGEPTADTRYGGNSERIFLEVQPRRVACHHPLIPDYQCLSVREITYDDRGIKVSTGEWQFLYQEIEGYQHQPGVRNVLRLKRYTLANPPADASRYVYVLDMVVESELVNH